MDFVASALGLPGLQFKSSARGAVMRSKSSISSPFMQQQEQLGQDKHIPFLKHRDSMLCLTGLQHMQDEFNSNKAKVLLEDDDDTASTVSATESYSSGSDEEDEPQQQQQQPIHRVRFAQELVTKVYHRPSTNRAEKHLLFYTDVEYRAFRHEYFIYNKLGREPRDPVVCFQEQIVTEVHTYDAPVSNEDKSLLYYSESDLKRFLNEFVASLSA